MKISNSLLEPAGKSICFPLVLTAGLLLYYMLNEPSHAVDQPVLDAESTDDQRYDDSEESWLQQQIRHFRSYPHLDRAYRLIDSGKFSEALRELEQYLMIDLQNVDARLSYVVVLYKLQKYKEVINATKTLLEDEPSNLEALKYQAYAYQYLSRAKDASNVFQTILRHDQASMSERQLASDMIVDFYIAEKKYTEALSVHRDASESTVNFKYYYRLGVIYDGQKRLDKARSAYRHAYQLALDSKDQLVSLLALGEIAKKLKNWREAENYFISAANLPQNDVQVIREIANAAYQQKKYDTAVRWIREALSYEESDSDREFLAHVLYGQGQYPEAIQEYIKVLTGNKNKEIIYRIKINLGYAYSRIEKISEAETAFISALGLAQSDTQKYDIHIILGDLAKKHQAWADAEKHYMAALTLYPISIMPMRAIAGMAQEQGDYERAIDWLNKILTIEPNQRDQENLAYLLSALNAHEDAIIQFNNSLTYSSDDATRYRIYMSLGYEYLKSNQTILAADTFSNAVKMQRNPEALLSLAQAQVLSGNIGTAEKLFNSLLEFDLPDATRATVLTGLGHIEYELERYDRAETLFRSAIAEGNHDWRLHQALATSLYQQKKWAPALKQFQIAAKMQSNPQIFLYMALCYKQLGLDAIAIAYINKALANPEKLTRVELAGLYSELGYLYAGSTQYRDSISAWDKSLSYHSDNEIVLNRSRIYRLLGNLDQAQQDLKDMDEKTLPHDLQLDRLNQLALIYAEKQQYGSAISAMLKAEALSSTAEQQYRLGLYYGKLQDIKHTIHYFEQAVSKKPNSSQYAASLGYAYMESGRYDEAIRLFESIVEREPDFPKIYQDLGYAQIQNINNDAAIYWFKRGIDYQSGDFSLLNDKQGNIGKNIDRMQREVGKLTNRYDFSFYQVYRSNADDLRGAASPSLDGGATPSQGGAKFTYQPPVIGFRDDRIFQLFARALWNTAPRTLKMDDESLQGGIGFRYKPLKNHGLFVGIEKLFEIGVNSIDDWLVRAQYSWDKKLAVSDTKNSDYYYLSVYADLGFFSDSSPGRIFYWETQLGKKFQFGPGIVLSPHLIANGQYQDSDMKNDSYTEAGLGIAMQYPFGRNRYQTNNSAAELRIQYKEKIKNQSSDWLITGVLHF